MHSNETDRIRKYRIENPELKDRYSWHDDESSLETVKNEIVLMRTMIEDRLSMANSIAERQAAYGVITPMVAKVGDLVEKLSKLQKQTSAVIGKAALHKLGNEIVTILLDELDDVPNRDDLIDRVAGRIASAIQQAKNED